MKRRSFLILFALSSASTAIAGCEWQNTPGKTVERFQRHLAAGEVESAINLLSRDITNNISREKIRFALRQGVKDIQDKQGIRQLTVTRENIVGDTASVSYTLTYGNGTQESQTVALVKEQGQWKLSSPRK